MEIFSSPKRKRQSPFLNIWPDINFMRESRPRLRVQIPIRIGDLSSRLASHSSAIRRNSAVNEIQITHSVRTNLRILVLEDICLGPWDINDPIDDCMRNMHSPRTKFPCQALTQCPQSKLTRRKGREICWAPYGGRCTGKDESWRVLRCRWCWAGGEQ